MTIGELINEMRASDDFATAFAASGTTGSGATNGSAKTGNGTLAAGKVKSVSARDQAGLNTNLEAIAAGEVTVSDL
jgi:hypothetical protein